jgi:hypothetical protein
MLWPPYGHGLFLFGFISEAKRACFDLSELYHSQTLTVVIILFRGSTSSKYFSDLIECSLVDVLCLRHQQSWYCTHLFGIQCNRIWNFMEFAERLCTRTFHLVPEKSIPFVFGTLRFLKVHLCNDAPLWLLGVHHPLRCVEQVVCNGDELEKGKS